MRMLPSLLPICRLNLWRVLHACMELKAKSLPVALRVGGGGQMTGLNADTTLQKTHAFHFDAIFGPQSGQEEVFEQTSPVVTSVLDGYSVCILAYGQTGSGKTWTMEGGGDGSRGLNFRAVAELFRLAHSRQADCDFDFHLSMMEVCSTTTVDLPQ